MTNSVTREDETLLPAVDPRDACRRWLRLRRPDLINQFEPIFTEGALPAEHAAAFMLMVSLGFQAGRAFDAFSQPEANFLHDAISLVEETGGVAPPGLVEQLRAKLPRKVV